MAGASDPVLCTETFPDVRSAPARSIHKGPSYNRLTNSQVWTQQCRSRWSSLIIKCSSIQTKTEKIATYDRTERSQCLSYVTYHGLLKTSIIGKDNLASCCPTCPWIHGSHGRCTPSIPRPQHCTSHKPWKVQRLLILSMMGWYDLA